MIDKYKQKSKADLTPFLKKLPHEFTLTQLEQASPGVSREMIRRVLRELKGSKVECIGRGPGAKWIKKG